MFNHLCLQTGEQRQARRRHKPGTADVHLIGKITGAVGFGAEPLYCTWQLVYDEQLWGITKGLAKGRTHACNPLLPEEGGVGGVVWEAPLDLALTTSSSQHWPAIVFKLFHRSLWLGRDEFVGYSLCTLPNTPGCHHVSCPVWAAVEARRGFGQELTSWFTGLTPLLVHERFITDLEQRYEQGQHLHTRDCSSGRATLTSGSCGHAPAVFPAARAVERIAGAAAAPSMRCRSFGAAGASSLPAAAAAGGLAGAGGRIWLRLHVLTRGLQELRQAGGGGVGVCLERLRDTVEKMRRTKELAAADDDEAETEGMRLVREGRAARLAAAQQHMADGSSNRDQQLLEARGSSSYGGGAGASGYSSSGDRASYGRLSPGRNTLRGIGSRDGRGSSLSSSASGTGGAQRISGGGGTDWQPAGLAHT
ncbi:ciliary basal body-associated, B9 protein-domain-containing protein [Scenedesmus sp. NREL 46B-D3]|nr:ciliary basal body-associated, B9 protein-domain-containing protein [Scenedesmus sp. NREL 46B-D3]